MQFGVVSRIEYASTNPQQAFLAYRVSNTVTSQEDDAPNSATTTEQPSTSTDVLSTTTEMAEITTASNVPIVVDNPIEHTGTNENGG